MMLGRRAVLRTGGAAALGAGMPAALAQVPGLGALAAAHGVQFGMMVTREHLEGSRMLPEIVAAQARMIVPGNELKWSRVEPARGRFDFANADFVMKFAADHGLRTRGHVLLWHEALPEWVDGSLPAPQMNALLWDHIRTVAGRYAGRMHSWDVVNEPIDPGRGGPGGLRVTPFLRSLGPSYIELAFRMAAEADPKALLTLNDYDLEMDTPFQAQRRAAMLDLLNRLVQRGVPVHALGIQAHLRANAALFDPEVFQRFIRSVASLGLQVFITELDLIDRELPADIAARDRGAAALLGDYLTAALAEPAVRMVMAWGVSDVNTWVNDNPQFARRDGVAARPNLYDAAFRPKPMVETLAAVFRAAPNRP